jgi:hypothetical protein
MTSSLARMGGFLDAEVVAEAENRVGRAIADFLTPATRPRGVVVTAPAGAGKSHLVADAVGRARDRGLRVAVAAPTNEQAFGLVRKLADQHCGRGSVRTVVFVPAEGRELPAPIRALPGVREIRPASHARGESLIVGTLAKLGSAFGRGDLDPLDVLVIDESYQADSAAYFAVGDLAPVHLLVGDGGQISPFTTIDDPARWRGLPEDPLQTAVGVLRRNHPATPVYGMPISRRLAPEAIPVARHFYPDLRFRAAVLPGVRRLRLSEATSAGRRTRRIDEALGQIELPRALTLPADPEAIELIVGLLARLFERRPMVRCELRPDDADLRPERVAVGVSHNDQKDFVRIALSSRGHNGVVVETANKLQGLEFDLVVAWHPLAGLTEPDPFHLDPGRLCVLLTRHRHACLVVGRAGDADPLEDQPPPSTPAYLGCDADPVLDGWEIHRRVFSAIEPFRIGF